MSFQTYRTARVILERVTYDKESNSRSALERSTAAGDRVEPATHDAALYGRQFPARLEEPESAAQHRTDLRQPKAGTTRRTSVRDLAGRASRADVAAGAGVVARRR